jgi:hypothetical protein
MKRALLLLLLTIALAGNRPAAAQIAIEVRGGASIGNDRAAASRLERLPGLALSIGAEYPVTRRVSAYAGLSRTGFGCEEGFCTGRQVSFESSGAELGVGLRLPHLPWLRAGMIYHELTTKVEAGADPGSYSSGHGAGYEVGTGFTIPITRRLRVLPGVGYRTHAAATGGASDRVSIVAAEIGVSYRM